MADEAPQGPLQALADLCIGRNRTRATDSHFMQKVFDVVGPYYLTRFTRTFGSQETKDVLDIEHTMHQLSTHKLVINSLCRGETRSLLDSPDGATTEIQGPEVPLDVPARLAASRCLEVADILERHLHRQNDLFPDDDGDPDRVRADGEEVHALSAAQTAALLHVWAERLSAYADDPESNRPILTEDLRPMPFENESEKELYGEDPAWFPEEVLRALREVAATAPGKSAPWEGRWHEML